MRARKGYESTEAIDDVSDLNVEQLERVGVDLGGLIAERWLKDKAVLHAHLRVQSRIREPQPQDLCVAFRRQGFGGDSVIQEVGCGVPANDIGNGNVCGEQHVDKEGAVLVHNVQLVEDGERYCVRCKALVRLRSLDSCPGLPLGIDSMKGTRTPLFLPLRNVHLELFGVGEDGESAPLTRFVARRKHDLPDEVIQGGSQAVDGVSADDAQAQRRLLNYWAHVHDVPRAVHGVIEGSSVGVGFKEGVQFGIERVEVFFRPLDLGFGTTKVKGHGW